MISASFFKGIRCHSYVCFDCSVMLQYYFSFVHHAFCQTLFVQWTSSLIMDDYLSYRLGIKMLNFPRIALNILILLRFVSTTSAKASLPGNFKLFFGFLGIFLDSTFTVNFRSLLKFVLNIPNHFTTFEVWQY